MSLSTQMDRVVAAFAAGGVTCQWIYGREVPVVNDWRNQIQNNRDTGKGGARNLIHSVSQLTKDPDVLKFCGSAVMAVSCGFAAARQTARQAQDALEAWIGEIYTTAGGEVGAPAAWPITYPTAVHADRVVFRAFEPFNGIIPAEPRPYGPNDGGIWIADCQMRMVFLTSL